MIGEGGIPLKRAVIMAERGGKAPQKVTFSIVLSRIGLSTCPPLSLPWCLHGEQFRGQMAEFENFCQLTKVDGVDQALSRVEAALWESLQEKTKT